MPGARAVPWLYRFAVICALYYLGLFVVLAVLRLPYRFELQWMEGAIADHVVRVLNGQPLYPRPSIEFISYIYPPLYYFVAALAAKVTSMGFFPLRLISMLATLGTFVLLYAITVRLTHHRVAGVCAAGLYAACYPLAADWYDLARIDALFLALTLLGVYLLLGRGWWSVAGAAVAMALAVMTKQSALPIAVFAALAVVVGMASWKRGATFLLVTGVLTAAGVLMLIWREGSWYTYFVWQLPGQHRILEYMWVRFWTEDLLENFAGILTIGGLVLLHPRLRADRPTVATVTLLCAGLVGSSWMSRLHAGGYVNVLMPAFTAMALLFGYSIARGQAWAARQSTWAQAAVPALACVQLLLLLYDPSPRVPTRAMLETGGRFVNTLATMPGEVFVPWHGYVSTYAGKRSYAHLMAILDVQRGHPSPQRDLVNALWAEAFRQQYFDVIIEDDINDFPKINPFRDLYRPYYYRAEQLSEFSGVYWTTSDLQCMPELVYRRRTPEITAPTERGYNMTTPSSHR
jgi:hypothetical protein